MIMMTAPITAPEVPALHSTAFPWIIRYKAGGAEAQCHQELILKNAFHGIMEQGLQRQQIQGRSSLSQEYFTNTK